MPVREDQIGGQPLERLLNIKETAEFLNVSEMTIRRWTNKGLLKCYRVGGRQARRFKSQDLIAYLESGAEVSSPELVPIGVKDFKVPDGSHITHLSRDPVEAHEVAAGFVMAGVQKGDTVCIVAPESVTQGVFGTLETRGADVSRLKRDKKLTVSGGMKTPSEQARILTDIATSAGRGFRIFGDMTWTKAKGWRPEQLHRFEEAVNQSPILSAGMLFLCQYKLECFTGEETMMAIETHSHNIYRGQLKENPYLQ